MIARSRPVLVGIALVAALGLLGAAVAVVRDPAGVRIVAYFTESIGIYAGSDVRVLGVEVGSVDSVRPEGTRVRTTLRLDHGVDVPAGVRAVVIAPTLVADRYVQLTPAYTGGPKAVSGKVITERETLTPMELDKIFESIRGLSRDLGPRGANGNGALSGALETGARNLAGNGRAFNTTVEQFGKAARTLSGSQDDLFGTIRDLQQFVSLLRANDGQVRLAERQLAQVAGFLAEDRTHLAAALRALAVALAEVKTFIADNRAQLRANVAKLSRITQILVDQRRSLAEALDVQPLNAANVLKAYDPVTQTLMGRTGLNELAALPDPPLPLPAAGPTGGGG